MAVASNRLIVRAKVAGRRGLSVAPIELDSPAPGATVRDLLEAIVRQQVEAFISRKQESRLLRTLTERDIAEGMETGKIATGDQEPDERSPDPGRALEAAVSAFQDGFYYIFVNDVQVQSLDQTVDSSDVTDVLFLRLTPLAGG